MPATPAKPLSKKQAAAEWAQQSEDAALQFLLRAGLTLVCRNWRCPQGELDLVMQHADELVVVEVRARASESFGGALASVTAAKQRKLVRATTQFLQAQPQWLQHPIRFDVIGFGAGTTPTWLKAAFEAI